METYTPEKVDAPEKTYTYVRNYIHERSMRLSVWMWIHIILDIWSAIAVVVFAFYLAGVTKPLDGSMSPLFPYIFFTSAVLVTVIVIHITIYVRVMDLRKWALHVYMAIKIITFGTLFISAVSGIVGALASIDAIVDFMRTYLGLDGGRLILMPILALFLLILAGLGYLVLECFIFKKDIAYFD